VTLRHRFSKGGFEGRFIMRCIVMAVGICLFATVCSAQEKYHNSKWHFSFTVPEGWKVATDDAAISNYVKLHESRFENAEVLAVCQEAGTGAEENKSSMLVQAHAIGKVEEGIPMEVTYEKGLHSNLQWKESNAYLKSFRDDLIKQGDVTRDAEYKHNIYYDPNRHIFFETIALPLKSGGAIGTSAVHVLGSNKEAILSFNLYGKSVEGIMGLVKEVANSFAYDEHYGFGEATTIDIMRILWHWLVPGAGTLIVMFILYKWIASEYG
jgi:hypothetical protein